jgi:hypothetical protein
MQRVASSPGKAKGRTRDEWRNASPKSPGCGLWPYPGYDIGGVVPIRMSCSAQGGVSAAMPTFFDSQRASRVVHRMQVGVV